MSNWHRKKAVLVPELRHLLPRLVRSTDRARSRRGGLATRLFVYILLDTTANTT